MADQKQHLINSAELRRRAEERLGRGSHAGPRTVDEAQRLLHELDVHKIELEIQNAELIKARDEAETALEKYTDLYEFAPVGYFTLDRKGTISSVNLTGSDLLRMDRSQLNGKDFGRFVDDGSRSVFTTFLEKVFTHHSQQTCKVALQTKGDSRIFVRIDAVASASGQDCRAALIDITKSVLTEEALRKEKEAMEALRKEKWAAEETHRLETEAAEMAALTKSIFLANMSHELRTPMTGVLGMLQLALEEEIAPAPRGHLETALSSARSLLRILNDILDMAKIEAGKFTIEEKPFSLRWCVTGSVDIITSELRRKGLDLTISVAEEVPDTVFGDQMRLRQVLINLIGNAVKFTEEGKVVVRLSSGRMTSIGKREFTFSVTDTGIGIPHDKKELLFQAFSQVDDSLGRNLGGTGLGLTISKEIVELMGGSISFQSKEGIGSTFSFTVPLAEAKLESDSQPAAEPHSREAAPLAPEGERVRRILLAEDDAAIREVLGVLLRRLNYQVDFAENGQKAVEMWGKGEYDLVLMDVQMPQFNGLEATCAIREKELERGCHTPIVAMTAHALQEDELRCLAAGMDAYISKPIDFEKALKVIEEIFK